MYNHNEICYRVANLSSNALTYTHVSSKPLINLGRTMKSGRDPLAGSHTPKNPLAATMDSEQKGNLLIRDLSSK